jgi:hypothetical protein
MANEPVQSQDFAPLLNKTHSSAEHTEKKEEKLESQNDAKKPQAEVQQQISEKEERLQDMSLDRVLKINTQSVDFGDVLPGMILEQTIIILNNLSNTKVPFKIKVNCLTKEFDELDEYVYSMRRPNPNDQYNYSDTFMILLAQKAISYYRLAIKVPLHREETEILGNIEISSAECPSKNLIIPIKSKIVLPNIKCEKMIHLKSMGMSVIKLYMKTPKRQDFRIALKNQSKISCAGELSILKNDAKSSFIDFNFYPTQITLNQQVSTNFMISIKCNLNEIDLVNKEVKAVLVIKVTSSSVVFAYPVIIIIGDGKGGETIS